MASTTKSLTLRNTTHWTRQTTNTILTLPGAGNPRSGGQHGWVLGEGSSPAMSSHGLLCYMYTEIYLLSLPLVLRTLISS